MSSPIYSLPGRTQAPATRGEKMAQWIITHRAQLGLALGLLALTSALSVAIVFNRRKLMEGGILQLSSARYQASKGQMKEAIQSIDEVLRSQRTSPVAMQAYILKGELLTQAGKFEEAAKTYQEGYGQASLPDYRALMWMGQASAAVELQKYPEAVDLYDRFIRDYPGHYLIPRCYMEVGRIRSVQKQWKEARAAYERLLVLYPKSPWAEEAQANLNAVNALSPSETPGGETKK
ncbi:MAG: tetratricopeptide repeat protein [Elusimicrobia bacterium]|nr:tetratricopeptide repeat protein [Elusimicrobiota bacterium]